MQRHGQRLVEHLLLYSQALSRMPQPSQKSRTRITVIWNKHSLMTATEVQGRKQQKLWLFKAEQPQPSHSDSSAIHWMILTVWAHGFCSVVRLLLPTPVVC